MRSIASMSLSFGLVSLPIKLYPATTESHDVEWHSYHQHDDGSASRLNQVMRCAACGEEIRRSDAVKGVEHGDQIVLVTPEELTEAADTEAGNDIEIRLFCQADEINPLMLDAPYYLAPNVRQSSAATDGYALLRDVLTASGLVGVVEYRYRSKMRIAVLRVADKVLILQNLRWSDEVRAAEFPVLDSKVTVDPRAVKMATQLVESLVDKFDPTKFVDTYQQNVAELVEAKAAGVTVTASDEEKAQAEVGDLLARLEASVKNKPAKAPAKRAAAKRAAPAKRAPASTTRTRRSA